MEHTGCALPLPSQELHAQRRVSVRTAQHTHKHTPRIRAGSPRRDGRTWKEGAGASPWRVPGWQVGRAARARFARLLGGSSRGNHPSPVPFFRVTGSTRRILGVTSRNTHSPLSGQGSLGPLAHPPSPSAAAGLLLQGRRSCAKTSAGLQSCPPRRCWSESQDQRWLLVRLGSPLHALRGSAPSLPPGL